MQLSWATHQEAVLSPTGTISGVPASLDELQLAAWRAVITANAVLVDLLGDELVARSGMALTTYDVLVQLSEAPSGRLRMSELADLVVLSRSGLTRLVDRMVRDGLVRRDECEDDRRGSYAVVTAAGRAALRKAWPVHVDGVARHFAALLDDPELAAIAAGLTRVAAAGREARANGERVTVGTGPRRA